MKLSILIVNWNSKDYLRTCLESIRGTCAHLSPQVVVVDGGSFDGCAEMLAADFPEVVFEQSPDNIGFGRCNNLGFDQVTGVFLLLLNPDTELQPRAVDELLAALQQTSDIGLVGARLLNGDGSMQLASVHPLPTPWNAAWDCDWLRRRWWNRKRRLIATEPFEVQAVSGACMMLRTITYRQLGGFDPSYFMYAEDMDLCLKIHNTGLKIHHAPTAVVIHHGGGSSSTRFSKFSTVMIREALRTYMIRNHGLVRAYIYRGLMGISAAFRLLFLGGLLPFSGVETLASRQVAIRKWWATLRWCAGLEKWSEKPFANTGQKNEMSVGAQKKRIRSPF